MSMDEFRRHLAAALECEVSQKIGAKLCPGEHSFLELKSFRDHPCWGCGAAL